MGISTVNNFLHHALSHPIMDAMTFIFQVSEVLRCNNLHGTVDGLIISCLVTFY